MKVRKAVNNCFMDFVREKCGETGSAISLIELLAIYLLQFWTNCCTNLVPFFVCQIWVITNSKSATNITWTFWMRNWGFVSPIFLPIFLLPLLNLSVMSHIESRIWTPLYPSSVVTGSIFSATLGGHLRYQPDSPVGSINIKPTKIWFLGCLKLFLSELLVFSGSNYRDC